MNVISQNDFFPIHFENMTSLWCIINRKCHNRTKDCRIILKTFFGYEWKSIKLLKLENLLCWFSHFWYWLVFHSETFCISKGIHGKECVGGHLAIRRRMMTKTIYRTVSCFFNNNKAMMINKNCLPNQFIIQLRVSLSFSLSMCLSNRTVVQCTFYLSGRDRFPVMLLMMLDA